jgi:hypothetical protein
LTLVLHLAALLAFSDVAPDQPPSMGGPEAAARVVFADVCLKSVVEARSIEDLAKASGMKPISSVAFGGTDKDKAWRLDGDQPVSVVLWADGGCTTSVDHGDASKLAAMARAAILARPEGFRPGLSGLFDGDRVQRDVYCAQRNGRWTLATITVPGPTADSRTRALSSSVYSRPTPSALCQAK